MNSYNLFKKVYLDLIMQSTIKDDYIDYFFKKENINGEYKKDPKMLEMAKTFIDNIFSELNLNNPNDSFRAKKQKALLYWLRNGTITDPTEQNQKQILQKAFNLLSKHASLNFQNFNSPIDMLNSSDKSIQKINAEYNKFNPETEPKFFNKKDLGDGIVVYQVENSKEGQAAVRKAIDSDWGYDKNPWCLAARKDGSLDKAWHYWERYNKIPKRIAFKNGKLHAFSATDISRTCQWWDKADKPSKSIPQTTVSDDPEFLKQFCTLTYVKNIPNSPLSLDILKKFSEHEDQNVRQQVARKSKCPVDILIKLSEDKDYKVREQVAKNLNCPEDILRKLSEDDNLNVRRQVPENPNCPLDILIKLSEDESYYVREQVARNPNCPLDILRKFSKDDQWLVRISVAENPNCPPDALKKLSEDDDWYIRKQVVKNPNCPVDILIKLSEDQNKWVRISVAVNPNCTPDILRKFSEHYDQNVRRCVAENPKCPPDILRKFSENKGLYIRRCVVKNPNCPLDILEKLSEDKGLYIRRGVAENPKCQPDVLKKLSKDKDQVVRERVARNPNCPLDILEKLANPKTEKSERVRFQAKKVLQSLKKLKNRTQDNNTPISAAPAPAPVLTKANNDVRTNNTPTDVTKMRVNKATILSENISVDNDSTLYNNVRINNDFSSPNNIRVDDVPAKGTTNTTKTNTTNKNNSTNAGSKSTFEQRIKEIYSILNKQPSWLNK